MLRVLLAEDNPREKRTIINELNQVSSDIQLVECFDNGRDALEWLRKNKADILISDIQMPEITGLKLLKILKQENINIKCIFVSCYDYFEYAQSALDLGAIAYVLKPILRDDLKKALNLAVSKCLTEKEDTIYQKQLQKQIGKVKYILQEQFIRNLLFSHSPELGDITASERIIDLKIVSGYKVIATFKTSKTSTTKCDLFTINCAIVDYIMSLNDDDVSYYPYIMSEDMFTLLLCFPNQLFDTVETVITLKNALEEKFLIKLIVGISNGESDATNLNSIYLQAKDAVEHAIGNTKNFVVMDDEINTDNITFNTKEVQSEIQEILSETYINFSDRDNIVKRFLNKYLSNKSLYSTTYIHTFTVYVINMLEITLTEYNKSIEDIIDSKVIFDKLAEFDTIQNVYFWIENNIRAAFELMQQNNESKNSRVTEMIKDIIASNYKSRLTIYEIAQKIHFSSKQAHRIFLKETGETILDYITYYRIKQAKDYLKQKDSKLYIAAQQVGYKNKTYFNELFKQYTGLTPQEYKAKHENQE